MAVNIHITIIELNALHTKRQNLFQELDAVIHLLMEAKHWGLRKSRNATSLNSRFKSLDTLKVKIISVTFRRVIRTNHKKASKIWRHENIQLGGCQSCRLFPRQIRANTISFTVFPEIVPSIGNSFINTMKNINHTRSSISDDIRNILCSSANMRRAIQNRVASNIGISQSTFSVKVLNLFSRSRRKTNKRKSKHSAMLRNKETRHRMFIGLLNTTRKLA